MGRGYEEFVPEPYAFKRDEANAKPSENGHAAPTNDMEELVRAITDQVMATLAGTRS
jgi:hypothetical protein